MKVIECSKILNELDKQTQIIKDMKMPTDYLLVMTFCKEVIYNVCEQESFEYVEEGNQGDEDN